jgi:hypothetical protein
MVEMAKSVCAWWRNVIRSLRYNQRYSLRPANTDVLIRNDFYVYLNYVCKTSGRHFVTLTI